MDRQGMQEKVDDLNQHEEVEDARIVEFLGKPHVHIDFTNGNIGVISQADEYIVIPIRSK